MFSRGEHGDDASDDVVLAAGDPPDTPLAPDGGVGRSMPPTPAVARGTGLPASLPLTLQRGVFGRDSIMLLPLPFLLLWFPAPFSPSLCPSPS